MADTLEIFGDEFTNVTGIKATDDNNQIKTYIRPQGTKSITQNGTGIDVTNYASVDVSVSGGGGESKIVKQINFIDYDGTVVDSYSASEWANISTLPSNPSHSGLTAQGWNWTKAQIDAQLTAMPKAPIWVGQMYITTSGDTEIDIELEEPLRLEPYLRLAVNGSVVVDWGDNTPTTTISGSSTTSATNTPHSYSTIGKYTIKIHSESGTFSFVGTNVYLLLNANAITTDENKCFNSSVKRIRMGDGITNIGDYAFYSCYQLEYITIPNNVVGIGTWVFCSCAALKTIVLPNGVSSIGDSNFQNCYGLIFLSIPNGIVSIGKQAFYNNYGRIFFWLPNGVESIGEKAFCNCNSFVILTIPNTVTSIGANAFQSCGGVLEYHVLPSVPPTVGSSPFLYMLSNAKIYVPSSSLSDYKSATNWSTYASHMVGE